MIEVLGLEKRFGKRRALAGVTFKLNTGVTGLLGPNGAGKTTLLRCMLGVLKPSGGQVRLSAGVADRPPAIGYLPQRFGMLKELTAAEALTYLGTLKKIPKSRLCAEVDDVLKRLGLDDRSASRVRSLSGGMVRRLGIAGALLGDPPVLVFDEPTAGLDPEERVRFKRLVSQLASDHVILISTHIVSDIEALADEVVVLSDGIVRASGAPDCIARAANGRSFMVPADRINEYSTDYYVDGYVEREGARLARVLAARALDGFVATEPTLEDGYLCLTRGIA